MVGKLFCWAVNNLVVVLLLTCTLAAVGGYAFTHVNVEAYPDPAPAIIGVVALYPGASAEEVERQVVVPLEVALAGMPGLKYTRVKSMFGLAYMLNQFDYGIEFNQAKQEVINRLSLAGVRGVFDPGVFRIKGQTNLAFPIDRAKCAQWNVSVADVEDVIETAVGGMPFSEMTEGEKKFDITLRWPEKLRENTDAILNIPVDVVKNNVTGAGGGQQQTPVSGATTGLSAIGTSLSMPALTGSIRNAMADILSRVPRRRLRDLVTPVDEKGRPDPDGSFARPGASTISREEGKRLIAVRFGFRERDLASTVAEAQEKTQSLLNPPYRTTWSGEFQQMQEAEQRMLKVVAVSLLLILIMLYLAFYSLLDALLVYANVIAMSLGGIWALILTGLNFNISAAVGFISILGVAVMNGLLMVSSFNHLRALKTPLRDAIVQGTEKLIRPVTMTALAAILGLLPAALSTRVCSQSQRPLAIVVVGGMITTLLLFNLVPFLYGHREPRVGDSHVAH
ncbi:MAG: hypothetical protein EXS05_02450 [Planctomycetaceae bacterium]|nr:hypothetical protein [Planctomycetaceae bacterium]